MSARVEASWAARASSSWKAGVICLASCLPSSTPRLVVGVDAPHGTLDERDVLVQGDELAEGERREGVTEDGGRRAVAGEHAGGDDLLGRALGANLVGRLAKGERLGLGEEIAQEELVHVLAVILSRVVRVGERDEVGGDHHVALVDELVDLLAVRAGLAPEDLAGVAGHGAAVPTDLLAVGLHGELLQIRREAVQVLGVGQHGVRVGAEEVDVPARS